MVTVPALIPVTTPVEPTVATVVVPLVLHVPPDVASLNVIAEPAHTVPVPVVVIDAGNGLTVNIVVVEHPVLNVYVISDVPGPAAVTTPVLLPIVATLVEPLVHVPPPVSDNVAVNPTHACMVPLIGFGRGLTVSFVVA